MSENQLDKQTVRKGQIEAIVAKNEISDVISYSQMNDPSSIAARFFGVSPEDGGFADLAQHEDLVAQVNDEINERLEEAKEEGKDINSWELYESVGKQVRKENLEYDETNEYGLYREPGKTVEDHLQEDRTDAIKNMAQSRGQDPEEV